MHQRLKNCVALLDSCTLELQYSILDALSKEACYIALFPCFAVIPHVVNIVPWRSRSLKPVQLLLRSTKTGPNQLTESFLDEAVVCLKTCGQIKIEMLNLFHWRASSKSLQSNQRSKGIASDPQSSRISFWNEISCKSRFICSQWPF